MDQDTRNMIETFNKITNQFVYDMIAHHEKKTGEEFNLIDDETMKRFTDFYHLAIDGTIEGLEILQKGKREEQKSKLKVIKTEE